MTTPDPELLAVFREEVSDAIETLLSALDALEKAGSVEDALAQVRVVRRVVHNIKGAARAVSLDMIELLTHALEDGLGESLAAEQAPPAAMVALLHRAVPLIEAALDDPEARDRILALVQEIAELSSPPGERPATPGRKKRAKRKTRKTAPAEAEARTELEDEAALDARSTTIRVRPERLDRLMDYSGELLALQNRRRAQHRELDELEAHLGDTIATLPPGERGLFREVHHRLEALLRRNVQELQQWERVTLGFKESVSAMRMRPLADFVPRWRQVVDRAAAALDLPVRFTADVGQIEIDRQILDGLWDPLMHLLHNAVGHGLARAAQEGRGDAAGRVHLRARTVGNQVELDLCDDGMGIDLERVRERGVETGLLEAADAQAATEDELIELLFLPGFSTARDVTRVSGRGVGLDVVRSRVGELGGNVTLSTSSMLGGASFRLTIPASVVSIRGLLVNAAGTTYVLPHANVRRTLRISSDLVRSTSGGDALEEKGASPLRLRWLSALMQHPPGEDSGQLVIVEVQTGNRSLGLVVDEVAGEEELVTRPLPWNLVRIRGVAGMVVLGSGTLAAVVDVEGLLERASLDKGQALRAAQERRVRPRHRLLVVDDSLTSRTLERNILEAAGYEVEIAVNGSEGWQRLQELPVDLVVSDVEMPEMNGFELTRQIRAHPEFERLPVILVTSLDRPEDLAAGAAAGADEYVVKGRFDHEKLLEAVQRLLGAHA
ncbi:MAG: response regulator [Deltaproteobacteria bacterium]|nr:response regulator [Deltaproteobacteria bacterium]